MKAKIWIILAFVLMAIYKFWKKHAKLFGTFSTVCIIDKMSPFLLSYSIITLSATITVSFGREIVFSSKTNNVWYLLG